MAPRTSLANLRPEPPAAPRTRTEPLQQHEINEAGYLAGRAALATPIDDTGDLRRLVAGNETVHETRTRLDVGRGNVAGDVNASRASSTYRTLTTHMAKDREDLGGVDKFERRDAAALALHAGNCDHNGVIATRLHGSRLAADETANVVGSKGAHHTWAEIRTPGRPSVTVDPWSNGPAMQEADTVWGERKREPEGSFDARTGRAARASLLRLADKFEHGPEAAVLAQQLRTYETERPCVDGELWGMSTPLAGRPAKDEPGFGDKARQGMARHDPVHQQVLAVGAARDAYRMTIPAAAREADAIVDAAQTLDTMPDALARPPFRNPDTLT